MARLLVVVCSVVAIDSMLSTALAPLLPSLTHQYHLSRVDSGTLVAAYYIGLVSVAVPTLAFGFRVSAKRATRDGVVLLGIGAIAFAFSHSLAALVAGRWLQGAGAMFAWSGASGWLVDASPTARRGFAIGLVAGVSSGGAVAGPALGAIAEAAGRLWTFLALGGLAITAGVVTMFFGEVVHDSDDGSVSELLRSQPARKIALPLWLVALPGAVIGGLAVLGPLALSHEGWSATGIAATYCTAAAAGLVLRPLIGSLSDKHGRLAPIAILLCVAAPITVALNYERWPWLFSIGLVAAVTVSGAIWSPAMAMLSDLCAQVSVSQTLGFALALVAMSPCAALGAFAAGATSQWFGNLTAYALLATTCAATIVVASSIRRTLFSFAVSPSA